MAKISKALAESVALQMTIALDQKREILRKEIAAFLRIRRDEKLPEEVRDFAVRFPTYFKTQNRLYPTCGQLSEYNRYPLESPVISTQQSGEEIDLCSSDYEWVVQMEAQVKGYEKQRRKLCREIEGTLLTLSSPKRIAEYFPQALTFLPADFLENKSTVPAVLMDNLLAELEQIKTL